MKGTRQFTGLCIGIGMTIVGIYPGFAQTNKKTDYSNTALVTGPIKNVQPLTIGEKVPDITFRNILNYKSKTAKLSDFKGKLVILDMWSVSCASCIRDFPKMEELQSKFKDQVQILLVNPHNPIYDSEEKIQNTLQRLKTRTGFSPTLPIAIHDSILNYYFPHQSVPHEVWIDKNGKVVAITGSKDVTEANIAALIEDKGLTMAVKNDWAIDNRKPLLIDTDEDNTDQFIYRSVFTPAIEGASPTRGVRRNEKNEIVGFYVVNMSLTSYLYDVFSEVIGNIPKNLIFYEVNNQQLFNKETNRLNAYCYDISVRPGILRDDKWSEVTNRYLKEDLKRAFNISVFREKRILNCLIFAPSEKLKSLATKHNNYESDVDNRSIKKYVHKASVEKVINLLNRFDIPMVNETDFNKDIDIEFPDNFDLKDKGAVIQYLKNKGFNIKEEPRELEVTVVTDK